MKRIFISFVAVVAFVAVYWQAQAQAPGATGNAPVAAPAAVAPASTPAAATTAAPAPSADKSTASQPDTNEPSEGYARPIFSELIQTLIMLNGIDITDSKVADEYGRLVYCSLWEKNFQNDVAWNRIRNEIVSRVQHKKEDFRVKYEVVSRFYLGRYDFKKQFFPIMGNAALLNVGSINLFSGEEIAADCTGLQRLSIFPQNIVLELKSPLTVEGFYVPLAKVEKMMVRMDEAGNTDRMVYGRIRLNVTDAVGAGVSAGNLRQEVLKGEVASVEFFLDAELTKPVGSIIFKRSH